MTGAEFPTRKPGTAVSVDGHPTLFPPLPYDMKPRLGHLLEDSSLQEFVAAATLRKDAGRRQVLHETFGDHLPALKDLAGKIKRHTLKHLDDYVETFIQRAEAAGVQVHFAKDATEANEICVALAVERGVQLCVKSKSMVTEETHLVPRLQSRGIETIETDLGEFILQLDRDAPSHIVMPMIHKDRTATARAFTRELGVPYTDDPQALTKIARRYLRDQYRRADFGVSGANFLIADTGTLVLCTNEGNGRFCTTLPRIHVAMVGIEKLVPSFSHAAVLLKLLARSSTAQPLTVYTQFITGPKQKDEIDGPDEVHVILVDNGRTDILGQPDFADALACIRCGACLNACPVYRKATGHSYGSVYSGPIGAVITPLLKGLENYPDLPHASSLCGACLEACPVGIDLPNMLINLRRDQIAQGMEPRRTRRLYQIAAALFSSPLLYHVTRVLARVILNAFADTDGFVRSHIRPFRPWTEKRDLPAPGKTDFRRWINDHQRRKGRP